MTPTKQDDALAALDTLYREANRMGEYHGSALIKDCYEQIKQALTSGAGGDNNVELLKRIRHFLQQVFENRVAKQLTVQVHHHRADTIGSLAEDLRDQINKALTADNAKRGE